MSAALGIKQSTDLQGVPKGVLGDLQFIRDVSIGPPVRSEGLSSRDVDLRSKMAASVLSAAKDDEILNPIVALFPIDVMNLLSGEKLAPEVLLHDEPMFFNKLPGAYGNKGVPSFIKMAATIKDTMTYRVAKGILVLLGLAFRPGKLRATRSAYRDDGPAGWASIHVPIIAMLGQVASNFVVFDPAIAKILGRE